MIMYRYKTDCHSFSEDQQEKKTDVNLFGHRIHMLREFGVCAEKCTTIAMHGHWTQKIETSNKMMDYKCSNYFGKQLERERGREPEEMFNTVNGIILQDRLRRFSMDNFSENIQPGSLLCRHTFFRWRQLFFAFIFRHVPLVCQCAYTHITKQLKRFPLT